MCNECSCKLMHWAIQLDLHCLFTYLILIPVNCTLIGQMWFIASVTNLLHGSNIVMIINHESVYMSL